MKHERKRRTSFVSRRFKSHCLESLSSLFPFCCERESVSGSVMSGSLQLPGPLSARFLCAWNPPGKNTGVHSHPLLQGIFPSQVLNLVSYIAGRLFTASATWRQQYFRHGCSVSLGRMVRETRHRPTANPQWTSSLSKT